VYECVYELVNVRQYCKALWIKSLYTVNASIKDIHFLDFDIYVYMYICVDVQYTPIYVCKCKLIYMY